MELLKIQLLGEFRLEYNGELVPTVGTQRLQTLLAYLLVHRGTPQPRQRVAFLLWPDSSEGQARTNLRNLVHTLRESLPDSDLFLSVDGQNLQWRPDARYWLDVEEFERASREKESVESLERAVSVYKGELLPGCYDEWVLSERQRLEREFSAVLERLIAQLEVHREYRRALVVAERLCSEDPLREDAYRKQMHLLGLMGDRTGVKRVYQKCRAVLKRELEDSVEPSEETQRAYEQALRADELALPPEPKPIAPLATPNPSPLPIETPAIVPPGPRSDIRLVLRRFGYLSKPYLKAGALILNYSVPVIVLGILVLALSLNMYISLGISAVLYLGLYLVLNPRTGSEQAMADLRDDIMRTLDMGRNRIAQIRRLQSRVNQVNVKGRIARICDLSDKILEKLAADRRANLPTAARLESLLDETQHVLELYLQIMEGQLVAPPENLNGSVVKIEDLLTQVESFLFDFHVKLDQGDLVDLGISIQVLLERLKLERLI